MIDKKIYKKELIRMWDSLRTNHQGERTCSGVQCEDCQLYYGANSCKAFDAFEMIESVEEWSRGHQQKKFKVSELEYYLLKLCVYNHMNVLFGTSSIICYLLRRGYFKGANENMLISEYFENCEIEVDE